MNTMIFVPNVYEKNRTCKFSYDFFRRYSCYMFYYIEIKDFIKKIRPPESSEGLIFLTSLTNFF